MVHQKAGDYEKWNEVWKLKDFVVTEDNLLYTKGKTKNLRQFWQRCYFNDLDIIIKQKGYKSFLEQGSGRGTTSMYISSHDYGSVTLVDLAPEAFNLACNFFSHHNLKAPECIAADVRETGLPGGIYDCIYSIGVLEHFHDPEPVLREAFRLLKQGGCIFMVVVPDVPFTQSLFLRIFLNPFSVLKYIVKKIVRKAPLKENSDSVRTEHSYNYYRDILKNLDAVNIESIPYNPYQQIYRNKALEKLVLLPLYKLHYNIKSLFKKGLRLRTFEKFSFCHLLIAYKK